MISLPKLSLNWMNTCPLIKGGAALKLSNLSMNVVFKYVSRVVKSLDDDGIAVSAHIMTYHIFSVGGIVLLALSVTAQTLVPSEMVTDKKNNSTRNAVVTTIGRKRDAKILMNILMH